MNKIFFGLAVLLLLSSNYAFSNKSSYKLDDIMEMIASDDNKDYVISLSYLIGLYDAIKINENISETVYGLKTRKFCFNGEPPKLVPDLIKMMDDYRQDDTQWNTYDPSYEVLQNDSAYVMTWTLISNFQCAHNIKE